MKLEEFGYNDKIKNFLIENNLDNFEVGRVFSEHKEQYIVKTAKGEYKAEITGNMRFSANSSEDFPAVGDWVTLTTYDSELGIIHKIIPRMSVISRQAVGRYGEKQIIATNVDYAFLIQSVDINFNINRLERYLTICNSSKVAPIIIFTKIDLKSEQHISEIINSINSRIKNVPIFAISNKTQEGYEDLLKIIEKGKTYCMLGSSGVGKSTLVNNLSGKTIMKTDKISQSNNKGRHVTSHREIIILKNGGILIDNPGMREVGISGTESGLETTFDKIMRISENCKFKNCSHINEIGCSVLKAVEKGELDKSAYENYLKIEKEKEYFESTVLERRKKSKKISKTIKNYKKINKKNK